MTESSSAGYNNFFESTKRFGLNVQSQIPSKTIKEFKDVAVNEVSQVANPFFNYLEKNEDVFNGNVETEIRKTQTHMFNTSIILSEADEKVNGRASRFDSSF